MDTETMPESAESFFKDQDAKLEGFGIYEENKLEQDRLDIPPIELEVVEINVPGEPVSGSQLKVRLNPKTGKPVTYRPASHKARKQDVYDAARSVIPEPQRPYFKRGTPVVLGVKFYFPYRAQDYGSGRNEGILKPNAPTFCIGSKDIDNLLKPLKDGLIGVVVNDDKQIVGYSEHWKLYSESPRTLITVKEIN